jgi:type IV secretion system protein VirD4
MTSKAAGIPLINDGKRMWVDNGDYHNLVIGATGSGKTKCLVDPMVQSLARKGESMIMTDPKGELYRDHSEMLRSRGYKIVVLNFRNPENGNAWNPLTLPYQLYKAGNTDKATELLDDVAQNILYDPENKNDPFWEKSAADFFSGLALGLFEDAKEDQINLNSINYMATVGEENFATSNFTKEYFTLKGENSNAYVFASNTINAPNETKGSILSVFRQKIRLFASREQLSEMLSYSDINLREIGTQKTAVFMIIHDEKTTYHALATIFLKQVYETLISVAQEQPKGKLPFRTNFILDEFANMPPLKDVTTMVTAARSRAIRFTFIIQNFAQLNDVYGKEKAETIRSNCGNIIYLITTELAALEEISKLCGEVKSKDKDKTASTPLITVSDLQKLKLFEVIILRTRLNPFRTKLTPSFEIDWGTDGYGKGVLPSREKRPIQLFDIKEFVKVKKRNKLFEALDNSKDDKKKSMFSPIDDIKDEPEEISNEESNNSEDESSTSFNTFNPFNTFSNSNNNAKSTYIDDQNDLDSDEEIPYDINEDNKAPLPNVENKTATPNFDVDDLVKRIDAKIAELEAEEKNKNKANVDTSYDKLDDMNDNISTFADIEKLDTDELKNSKKEEPVVNIDKDSVVVDDTTDDQYYDDFFNDEDDHN